MGEQTKNLLIGVFIIGACTLLVSIILFLKPTVGDGKKILHVRFANINKITVGTRVTFAGRPVGEVVAISEIFDARAEPTDLLGNIYYYQLTLKVDSSVVIYDTDQISLQTSGLLGEKSIAIQPKEPPKGVIPKLITDQPIYAQSVDPIENAFTELSEVADKMQDLLDEANCWFKENKDGLSKAVDSFGGAMHEAETFIGSLNTHHFVTDLQTAIQHFSKSMKLIDDGLEQLHQENAFANTGEMIRNFKSASQSVDIITQDIASGKGTLGKLIESPDMYLQASSVMSKVDTLMNDINHYGMLFHLNKSWQRTRLKRMNLLNALETPSDFKNYFETEVSEINTAMSRIGMLVDKAQESPEKEAILSNEVFKKEFAELMQQADELADNLRLYNQKLQEAQGN